MENINEALQKLHEKRRDFIFKFREEPNIVRVSNDVFDALYPCIIGFNYNSVTIFGMKIEIDDTKNNYMAVGYLIESTVFKMETTIERQK